MNIQRSVEVESVIRDGSFLLAHANHDRKLMDDLELLKNAGLYLKDLQSGKEGLTLGGILLFGNDQLIHAALAHYRTDALLRREDTDRYDDRDDIRTNLIDSYERLMQFVAKHLNDKFYLENDQRISLRDKIFREVISNILIHREFANPFLAKLVIEKDRVFAENSNKPHGNGIIDPYNKIYSGAEPTFIEGDVFKTIIPLISQASDQASDHVGDQDDLQEDRTEEILEFCKTARSRSEIQDFVRIKSRRYFREKVRNPLIKGGLLKSTIPENPKSPNQKYKASKNRPHLLTRLLNNTIIGAIKYDNKPQAL